MQEQAVYSVSRNGSRNSENETMRRKGRSKNKEEEEEEKEEGEDEEEEVEEAEEDKEGEGEEKEEERDEEKDEEEGEEEEKEDKGGGGEGGGGGGGEEEEEEGGGEEKSANPTYCVLDLMPCDLVDIYRRFRGAAGGYSEKSVKYVPQYTASHPRNSPFSRSRRQNLVPLPRVTNPVGLYQLCKVSSTWETQRSVRRDLHSACSVTPTALCCCTP
jgi:hypothetical protein